MIWISSFAQRRMRIAAITALLMAVFVMSGIGLRNMANAACTNPAKVQALQIASANGCTEFWINRYQGLLGGVLALIGAGLTVAAVRMQILAQYEVAARTARVMAIASLEKFHSDCGVLLTDADNPEEVQSGRSFGVPSLSIYDRPEVIAQLGPSESAGLFRFCQDIQKARQATEWDLATVGVPDETRITSNLKDFERKAERLINKFRSRVQWGPFGG